MKKNKKLLLIPTLIFPAIILASCGSSNINNQIENNKNPTSDEVSKNLTDDQVIYINKENVDALISKFSDLLSNDGVLNLSIFKNLESIKSEAFMGKNISSIVFNDKIASIEDRAFKGMASLKELSIPETITYIGENAFDNAFINTNEVIVNFDGESKIKSIGNNAFLNNTTLKIIATNENIKKIIIDSKFEESKIIHNNNNLGGYFSGLNVSKYLSIISVLGINKNTVLSSLTNEKLNQQLNLKFPNNNYSVSILSGSSEYDGILNLNLSINSNQNETIKISGFNSIKNTNYVINKMVIDSDKWFANLQRESNIETWTKENWISYLSNLEISGDNNEYDLLQIGSNVNYKFEYDKNKKTTHILLSTNYKKFDGSKWDNELNNFSEKRIGILNNTGFVLEIPNENKLYDFIKNILEINNSRKEEMINSKYSSYYSHAINGLKQTTLLNNILNIPDKYINYIRDNLGFSSTDTISIEFINVFANDIDGILRFNYEFKKRNNIDSILFNGSYEINGFKKLSKNNFNISMNIKKDASLFKTSLKQINNLVSKDKLNSMQNNETIEINNFGFGPTSSQLNLLYDGDDGLTNSKKTKFEQLIKNYSILIGGTTLESNLIDFSTNYFNENNRDQTKGYVIKYLSISTDKTEKAFIKKTHLWTYSFPITISLGISNSNSFSSESTFDMEIKTNCTMTILSTDIASLKK